MRSRFTLFALGLTALGLASLIGAPAAQAGDLPGPGRPAVINSADSGVEADALTHPRRGAVYIVRRPVAQSAAVVSRGLHEQPVYQHLIELHRGGTTVYVDPSKNYLAKRPGHIDQDNSLIKAQRLYHALHTRGAHVVRNRPARGAGVARRAASASPRPILRLQKPRPTPRMEPNSPDAPKVVLNTPAAR